MDNERPKATEWDVPLPFPPADTGPVSRGKLLPPLPPLGPSFRPGSLYEHRCYACGESYEGREDEEYYCLCGECFHTYWTAEELVLADARWHEGRLRDPADILVCPCCAHDF